MRYDKHIGPFCTHSLTHHCCNCRPQSPPQAPNALHDRSTSREHEAEGTTDIVHGERRQSDADADAAAAVCEQRTRETCVRARYRTIYGRHDIVRSTNPRSISRYRVIDMITNQVKSFFFRANKRQLSCRRDYPFLLKRNKAA